MAGTIWFIVEGQNDSDIVSAIIKRRFPQVRVSPLFPTGKNPNLSRLAAQIERLIKQALANRKTGDCIAVLHDADLLSRPHDRDDYETIHKICQQYRDDVRLVLAGDEIESWLLADEGFCLWLGEKPQNCDGMRQPSLRLASLLDKNKKTKYRLENLTKLLVHISGITKSPSLRVELKYLENSPCTLIDTGAN